jgi:hypothetical protein
MLGPAKLLKLNKIPNGLFGNWTRREPRDAQGHRRITCPQRWPASRGCQLPHFMNRSAKLKYWIWMMISRRFRGFSKLTTEQRERCARRSRTAHQSSWTVVNNNKITVSNDSFGTGCNWLFLPRFQLLQQSILQRQLETQTTTLSKVISASVQLKTIVTFKSSVKIYQDSYHATNDRYYGEQTWKKRLLRFLENVIHTFCNISLNLQHRKWISYTQ